jgi:hypothetical protein
MTTTRFDTLREQSAALEHRRSLRQVAYLVRLDCLRNDETSIVRCRSSLRYPGLCVRFNFLPQLSGHSQLKLVFSRCRLILFEKDLFLSAVSDQKPGRRKRRQSNAFHPEYQSPCAGWECKHHQRVASDDSGGVGSRVKAPEGSPRPTWLCCCRS